MSRPQNVGIKAIELYFPRQCVEQSELEKFDGVTQGKYTIGLGQTRMSFCDDREDIYSLALTTVSSLLRKYSIDPTSIGRLEVGTETILDKSKSVKTVLMQLFQEHGNTNMEGVDTLNACYGGTNALFNSVNWIESSSWDGRDAIVVAGDIAIYKKGNARPTGGAGCVAMLIGPDAPIAFEPGLRGTYIAHTYDFYKPDLTSEYPVVDGQYSLRCYTEALDKCYHEYHRRAALRNHSGANGSVTNGHGASAGEDKEVSLDKFDYMCFHAPTGKTVIKSYARLLYNDFMADPTNPLFKEVPETLKSVDYQTSLTDKSVEKVFVGLSKNRFARSVQPSTTVPMMCGNMYCASVYSSLASLLTNVDSSEMQGKRIAIFSFGSGLASSLFSLKVRGSLDDMKSKLDLHKRLEARKVVPPQTFDDMCNLREKAHLRKGFTPAGVTGEMFPGTYYLTGIDEKFRRSYSVKTSSITAEEQQQQKRMSLTVLNAHTGEQYVADQTAQRSLETLKGWLSRTASVVVADQILLTPAGKQVKLASLSSEPEIFLYDRRLIASPTRYLKNPIVATPNHGSLSVPPPDLPMDQNDIEAWTRLFESRRDWAQDVVRNSKTLAGQAQKQYDGIITIQRGLGVAVGNLQSHVRTLQSKHGEARDWGKQTSQEQEGMIHLLENTLGQLPLLPAKVEFIHFLPKLKPQPNVRPRTSTGPVALDALTHPDMVNEAVSYLQQARESMLTNLEGLESAVHGVVAGKDKLLTSIDRLSNHSILDDGNSVAQLMDEIEVVARKITSDCDHVANLPATPKSIAQASKMSTSHLKSYLPPLRDYFAEMKEILQRASEEGNSTATHSLENMQAIARIEASFSQVNAQLMGLDLPEDVENSLQFISLVNQLPFVYGALLVEGVRRREWSDRLRADSATLAEDIAGYREEEEKRRKRWLKNIGHLIDEENASGSVLTFDLNLGADEQKWPEVNRDDISEYLHALRSLSGVEEIVDELSEAAKDLDKPTKRQVKRAKGFKMGGVHESTNGKGSFLLHERDDAKVLRDLNGKLEEDLKSQKSRIRKLEELLYRQSELRRPSSANLFTPSDGQRTETATPVYGSPGSRADAMLSRRDSIASRRPSSAKSADEKTLTRRIVTLEGELAEERRALQEARQSHETALQESKQKQEREAQARANEAQVRADNESQAKSDLDDYQSTKKDLMENMEAQQREFADERRLLQEDVKDTKLRLEKMEDEIDRVLGSRDIERQGTDEKLRIINAALEEARRKIAESEEETASRRETEAEHLAILQSIRSDLAGHGAPPQSITELLHSLEDLAGRSRRQVTDLKHAIDGARSDKDAVRATLDRQEKEFESSKGQTRALEQEVSLLRNDHAAEKAKAESLSHELDDARAQLKSLRAKFAEGETGSEALRGRLEEQASRAGGLATELAQAQSHVNSLDVELSSLQRRHQKAVAEGSTASKRLEQRSVKDRELTTMLTNVQEELVKLLDALGLSIIELDGVVAIQRTSKLNTTSTSSLADPTVSLVQTPSVNLKADPALLQWMHSPTVEEEAKAFASLVGHLSTLDMSTFSEAIIKLRRDVEWTGKKWKQEARNYRDKYHRAQSEAHEKIAFRSFKDGDLALFLPTRNQATRPWAAFNVGAPHYFLREQDAHKLQTREWLVARISKVEGRLVDLSKTMSVTGQRGGGSKDKDSASIKSTASEGATSFDDDNPFELSDGLRWYLLDAHEERPGAPSTPGLGKSTVAAANVDAKGSVRLKPSPKGNDATAKLGKSLESRRSSSSSKRASISAIPEETQRELAGLGASHLRPGSRSSVTAPTADPSGLAIGTSGSPSASSPQRERGEESSPIITPSRYRSHFASPSVGAPLASHGQPPLLNRSGSSTSPPISSWSESLPSKRQPSARAPGSAKDLSPSKSRLEQQQQGKQTQTPTQAQTQQAKPPSPLKKIQLEEGQTSKSSNVSPRKSADASKEEQGTQTAWESLWSLDLGFEEGKGGGRGGGRDRGG